MSEDKTECKLPDPIRIGYLCFYCEILDEKRVITYDGVEICECQASKLIAWLNNAIEWCKYEKD